VPPNADARAESRTGHVSPPQGRGELGGRDLIRLGRLRSSPERSSISHRTYVRSGGDARRHPRPRRGRLELTRLLRDDGFDDTAERLENAYDLETKVLALTIADRESILRALDAPPDGLAELRGVLLAEHEGRVREGLV
jgi:hypothetical protein